MGVSILKSKKIVLSPIMGVSSARWSRNMGVSNQTQDGLNYKTILREKEITEGAPLRGV